MLGDAGAENFHLCPSQIAYGVHQVQISKMTLRQLTDQIFEGLQCLGVSDEIADAGQSRTELDPDASWRPGVDEGVEYLKGKPGAIFGRAAIVIRSLVEADIKEGGDQVGADAM